METKKNKDVTVQAAKPRRRIRLRHLYILLAAMFVVTAAWVAISRFMASLDRRISRALSSETVDVEISGTTVSLLKMQVRADSIAAYPHGGARQAAIAISRPTMQMQLRASAPGVGWIREVRLESVVLDADALSSIPSSNSPNGGETEIPEISPIRFHVGRFAGLGSEVRDIGGTLSAAYGTISIDGASASFHGRGEHTQTMRGRIAVDPSGPSVEAVGSGAFDFSKLVPVLRGLDCGGIAGELGKFEFMALPPDVEILYYWAPKQKARSLSITVKSGPMRYNGVRISQLSGAVHVGGDESWDTTHIDPLEVKRPEGTAEASLEIDSGENTLAFDCASTLDPVKLAAMLGLVDPGDLRELAVESPAELRCSGVLDIGDAGGGRTDINLTATVPGATARGFRFSEIAVAGGVKGGTIDFPAITAKAMGGSLEGSIRLDGTGDGRTVSASLNVRGVPQAQWANLIGDEEESKAGGKLDVSATYEGPFSELSGLAPTRGRGTFSADITGARLFQIPLFAGLTGILSRYIPGVDFLVNQSDAHIRATLDDGKWNLSSLSVSGAAFSIDGSGTAMADGSQIDIVARIRLMNKRTWIGRVIQRLLSPLSGLLGVRATGSVDSPRWAMAPFSKSSAK
ncbi:MAG: hypothetical protein IKH04_11375 [Kiritimatiellae bacterium]|nr:hypothetical protein [Kiritimatiellia bacterium]